MRQLLVERWSRRASLIHSLDPRAKVAGLLIFLVGLATTPMSAGHWPLASYAAMLLLTVALARLPMAAVLARSAVVLPFTVTFGLMSWVSGDRLRAVSVVEKSWLSATAVLLVAATTPIPELLGALASFRVPKFLLLVVQFLYRYLFVVVDEAREMHSAALSRAGDLKGRAGFRAATGLLNGLFSRSYSRAEAIHRAMIARGFDGTMRLSSRPRMSAGDFAFLAVVAVGLAAVRVGMIR